MTKANSGLRIVLVNPSNVRRAYRTAKDVFPCDASEVRLAFIASLMPKVLLPAASHAAVGVRLKSLDYFAGVDKAGGVVGITGLYSAKGRRDAWIGWYGVAPLSRGQGYGNELLNWTIETARGRGFETLRLWTSTSPEYVRANVMYIERGFIEQKLEVVDQTQPQTRLTLYALGLRGQTPKPFFGDLREALLGSKPKNIEKVHIDRT